MLRRIKELASDSATYGASSVLSQFIGFFLLPVYTRFLTPSDYGILTMTDVVLIVFIPFANLGISNAVFRFFNMSKEESEQEIVLGTGLISVYVTGFLFFLVGQSLAQLLATSIIGKPETVLIVRITLVTAFFAAINTGPTQTLRALRRVKTVASLNVLRFTINVLIAILLVVVFKYGIIGVLIGALIAEFIFHFVSLYFIKDKLRFTWSRKFAVRMYKYGLPIMPHRLMTQANNQVIAYLIRKFLGLATVGLYGIAYRFASPLHFLIGATSQAWVPLKFQIFREEEDNAEQIFSSMMTYYFAFMFFVWVGLSVWGPRILILMLPAEYHSASVYIPWLGVVHLARGLYLMSGSGFGFKPKTHLFPLISLSGFIVAVGGCYLFVPQFGLFGAILPMAAGWLMQARVMLFLARSHMRIKYEWRTIALFGFSAIGLVFLGNNADFSLPIFITLATLVCLLYPAFVIGVLWLSPRERPRIKNIFALIKKKLKRS
ncbi:oligosaccharide flippase family protein [bacterium]|nr:oligosaccharide flippase family protein [bacterium]